MTCALVNVPLAHVATIWPHVSGLIYVAMKKGAVSDFAPVQTDVLTGKSQLWVAWDDAAQRIEAAAVTELVQTECKKICVVVAIGGKDMMRWLELETGIADFAKAEGCTALRLYGRMGWKKLLPHWNVKRLIMERAL